MMVCRREMMPLLSLIFSALFILFGTVVIQAFRSEYKHCSCIKPAFLFFCFTDFRCAFHLGKKQNNFFCVFVVTQARITRLRRKPKMGRGQKMGHRELAELRGKNAEFISTWIKSWVGFDVPGLLCSNCYLLAELPGRTLWRSQS